jgi:hypothetical protein
MCGGRAYAQKKLDAKLAELSNKATYPYDLNAVVVK